MGCRRSHGCWTEELWSRVDSGVRSSVRCHTLRTLPTREKLFLCYSSVLLVRLSSLRRLGTVILPSAPTSSTTTSGPLPSGQKPSLAPARFYVSGLPPDRGKALKRLTLTCDPLSSRFGTVVAAAVAAGVIPPAEARPRESAEPPSGLLPCRNVCASLYHLDAFYLLSVCGKAPCGSWGASLCFYTRCYIDRLCVSKGRIGSEYFLSKV